MVRIDSPEAARHWLDSQGKRDFGSLWPDLKPVVFQVDGWPIGVTHVTYMDRLFEPALSEVQVEHLTLGYVYLAIAFFCIDHVWDGDVLQGIEPLAGPLMLAVAEKHLGRSAGPPSKLGQLDALCDLLARFSSAMLVERALHKGARSLTDDEEREYVVGRSALIPFMVNQVLMAKGLPPDESATQLFESAVFYLQMGDDWGDWREDFRIGNQSTFLRLCASRVGSSWDTEAKLERFVYLSGIYEEWGQRVAKGLQTVIDAFQLRFGDQAEALVALLLRHCQRVEAQVEVFRSVKAGLEPQPIPRLVH